MKKFGFTAIMIKIVFLTGMLVIAVAILSPVLFTIITSFMKRDEVLHLYGMLYGNENEMRSFAGFHILPDRINFEQYINLFLFRPSYLEKYINSIILTFPIVSGQVVISCFAAYGFAKLVFPFRDKLFFLYIIVMLMPFQVTLIPNYIMMDQLGLMGSFESVILPGMFSTFGVFLLRQFMYLIPDEYIEAAKIDGAKVLQTFFRIVIPQCKSAIASLFILSFLDNWNMVEQPMIMLTDEHMQPFSLLLAYINDKDITLAFAGGVIYMVPALCFALFSHTYLVRGIQMSGLK